MEAASGGHVEVAQVLLNHGAGVNTQSTDSKQNKTDEMHTGIRILFILDKMNRSIFSLNGSLYGWTCSSCSITSRSWC